MIQQIVTKNKALKLINTSLQKQAESIRDLTQTVTELNARFALINQTRRWSSSRSTRGNLGHEAEKEGNTTRLCECVE
ncbi:hypothetical protein CHS0354_028512 [Potamilus streckersoni]|uniref:Uncharacterized protein n=1 Tax=Potamilus streckersoni TaxID=2493646 RepID=A0AAE0VFH6_9BIVA|nr:hypothetical protein CHS0354_028512 [Potamilus streckersoni]